MPGLMIALRDALGVLVSFGLLLALDGLVLRGGWFWLAASGIVALLAAGWAVQAFWRERRAMVAYKAALALPDSCPRCGTPMQHVLICPQCGYTVAPESEVA